MADPAVEKHEELRQAPDAELHQQVEDEEEEGEEEEEEAKEVEAAETDGSIAPPSLGLNSAELATPDKVAPSQELLAAPQGWHKKITSTKKGKKDVCFVAPDGEEIKSKRTLDRYLKSHAGGPSSSEFDWSTGETPTRRSSRISSRTPPSFENPQRGSAKKRSSISALSSEGGSAQKRSRTKTSEKDEPESIEPQPSSDDVSATKDKEEILIARVTKEDEEIQGQVQVQVQDEKMEDVVEEELVKNVERNEIISKDESVVEEIAIIKSEEVKVNVSDDTRTSGDVKVEEVKDTGTEVIMEEVKDVGLDTVINEESNKTSEDITITSDETKEGNVKENATIVTDEKTTIEEIHISSGTATAEDVIAKSSDETKAAEELITRNGAKVQEEEEEVSKTKSDETKNDEGKNGEQGSENEPNQNCPEAQKNLSMSSVHAVST